MVLGSGSAGNCTLVDSGRTKLLIDCGLSARETARRLRQVGCEAERIDAVVISHEHSDHVSGARVFSRRFEAPLYTTPATARAARLDPSSVAGLIDTEPGRSFTVGDLTVDPFSVPHDAADNVGFVVRCGEVRVGYATDLGHPSTLVAERLKECDILIAEANHDAEMLRDGPYPWSVKQRVASRHGHLSNEQMTDLVSQVASRRTRHLLLAHMSAKNNTPALALEAGRRGLETAGRSDVRVHVTSQDRVSEAVER